MAQLTSVLVNTEGDIPQSKENHMIDKIQALPSNQREPTEPDHKRTKLRSTVLVVNLQTKGMFVGTMVELGRARVLLVPAVSSATWSA